MSRYNPHQGERERARRRDQMKRASIKAGLPNFQHGTFWTRARVRRAVQVIYQEQQGG